mgnify:CR=1 FL=1
MTLAAKFSENNVATSVSSHLANRLVSGGYFVYWHAIDALQTPSGWYYGYTDSAATLLADDAFLAFMGTATGILTLTDHVPAAPRFITRHISDGTVPAEDEVMVPAMSVEVGASRAVAQYELGTGLKWRERRLVVEMYTRTPTERATLKDSLAIWLDLDTSLTVLDHDADDLAEVGAVRVDSVLMAEDEDLAGPEATTYAALLSAFLEYVA